MHMRMTQYADQVVAVTDNLVEFRSRAPLSISQEKSLITWYR